MIIGRKKGSTVTTGYRKIAGYFRSVELKNDQVQIPPLLWIVVILTFVIIIPLHTYNDILITAKQSINFWNLLFEERPLDFYMESTMFTGNAYYTVEQGAAYLFSVYLVFAIWNFPTWLLEKITGLNLYNSIPSMIWMKMVLVSFIIVSAIIIYKIVKESEYRKYAQLAAFLFCSSILTIYPTAIIGQYDIFGITFILLGLQGGGEKNNRKFITAFAIAITFKYFALLYFLPLLLIREKRIFRILASFAISLVPSLLLTLLFPRPSGSTGNLDLIWLLLSGPKIYGLYSFYIFAVVFALVLIAAYFIETDDEFKLAVNLIFITMASFCIFADPFPYWVIFSAPAFVLLVVSRKYNMNKILILESMISLGIAIKNYIVYYWCVGIKTTAGMGILHRIIGAPQPDVSDSFSVLGMFTGSSTVYSLIFTGLTGLFIVMVYFVYLKRENKRWEPLNYGIIYLRTFANCCLAFLPAVGCVIHMIRHM